MEAWTDIYQKYNPTKQTLLVVLSKVGGSLILCQALVLVLRLKFVRRLRNPTGVPFVIGTSAAPLASPYGSTTLMTEQDCQAFMA